MKPTQPRVGPVLSVAGARKAAHVGMIEVLEEPRVPLELVVWASTSSIVGGLYAGGHPLVRTADALLVAGAAALLSDDPPRGELWFRRRGDDRRLQVDLELGWRGAGMALAAGLISVRSIAAGLERLLLAAATTRDFDRGEPPCRGVTTDLADPSHCGAERNPVLLGMS